VTEEDFITKSKSVKKELKALLITKYTLKQHAAAKVFLESGTLLLAWCYVIYCEDLVANFTFIALSYYSLTMKK
jgi:hypothetical protein